MNSKTLLLFLILICTKSLFGQDSPEINIRFSKLYATYEFIQKLSDKHPDNIYKKTFKNSKFNTKEYTDLIKHFDILKIHEKYDFQGYPTEQKIPGTTTNIIKKNLILNHNLNDFKKQTFGIVPGSELLDFTDIIKSFEPVYNELIYSKNKIVFDKKVNELSKYASNAETPSLFQAGLNFYGAKWDNSIPFEIVIIPSFSQRGFTATAFLNIAVSEIQMDFESYDVLLSVLMHEIYHILYDEQPLSLKLNIKKWFGEKIEIPTIHLNELIAILRGCEEERCITLTRKTPRLEEIFEIITQQ